MWQLAHPTHPAAAAPPPSDAPARPSRCAAELVRSGVPALRKFPCRWDRWHPGAGAYYADRPASTDTTAAAGMTSTGRSAMCSSSCETLPSSARTRPPAGADDDLIGVSNPGDVGDRLGGRPTDQLCLGLGLEQLVVAGQRHRVQQRPPVVLAVRQEPLEVRRAQEVRGQLVGVHDEHDAVASCMASGHRDRGARCFRAVVADDDHRSALRGHAAREATRRHPRVLSCEAGSGSERRRCMNQSAVSRATRSGPSRHGSPRSASRMRRFLSGSGCARPGHRDDAIRDACPVEGPGASSPRSHEPPRRQAVALNSVHRHRRDQRLTPMPFTTRQR